MRKTLTILVATTALTTAIGALAWSAMQAPKGESPRPFATLLKDGAQSRPIILASDDDDDDDDDHHRYRESSRRGHDDDDDDDCDDCRGGARNPTPAGTIAPPQNGLFGNGAPPQVQMN